MRSAQDETTPTLTLLNYRRYWLALAAVAVLVLLGVAVLFAGVRSQSLSPAVGTLITPTPSAVSPTTLVTATAAASPVNAPGTFENPILGYRITLPKDYRRSRATIVTGQEEVLGGDHYTLQTDAEARAQCLRDTGDVGSQSPARDSDIQVGVSRNVRGISAIEWATTPRVPGAQPLSMHQKVEPTTIGGHEAARLVTDNATPETTAFVIRANDRVYVLGPTQSSLPSRLPKGWIDDIANTFVASAPQAFPSPTPSQAPREAARQVGEALAKAFAARDTDAVVGLMPSCWVFVTPLIDGQPPGGILYRSVALFTQGLRDRFAAGDLTVTVDPTLQVEVQGGRERFFVRSDWREPDRTTRIDLYVEEFDGRWQWTTAQPHYQRADFINGCIPYRSPWVPANSSC